jgi:LysR family glycine cleavage system transcriptional activator
MSMSSESAFPTWRSWLAYAGQTHAGHTDIPCDGGMRINDSAAVIQAAIAGNGVALGRTTLVAADIAAGRPVRLFEEALSCDFAYYIVHKAQKSDAPFILAFTEWLLDEAQEQ